MPEQSLGTGGESFPPGQQPQVQVRVGGQWHDGVVWHKIRYRDGRHAVQVKVTFLEGDGFPVVYWRTYWWSPDAIRVVRQPSENVSGPASQGG
ncbi:hypothetical protein PV703_05615 [Streptomyces sp. ME01-24h]|nr:hypothetical protein [Streptomyces sp. ME19-03-3]MDX3352810.1 hypothetical protein [Streptomyces sp. ME01-24h]